MKKKFKALDPNKKSTNKSDGRQSERLTDTAFIETLPISARPNNVKF